MMESLKKVTAGDSADGLTDEFSMPQFYLCILYHARDNLKRILEFAMEPSHHPLIVNCTMGKDRTGNSSRSPCSALGSALIYWLCVQGLSCSCCCGHWAWRRSSASAITRSRTAPPPGR